MGSPLITTGIAGLLFLGSVAGGGEVSEERESFLSRQRKRKKNK